MPLNDVSATIFYNQRMIISAPIPEPVCWRLTKVEDTSPNGVRHFTFAQDIFNQFTDYIEKDEDGKVIGMYADYYQSSVSPTETITQEDSLLISVKSVITMSGQSSKIRVGGSKIFTVTFYEEDEVIDYDEGIWSFFINNEEVTDELDLSYPAKNEIKVKIPSDNKYVGEVLYVYNTSGSVVSSAGVEIIAL